MRNEKLGADNTALTFDFDDSADYADVKVSVGGVAVNGGFRIFANGTIAPPSLTTTERNALSLGADPETGAGVLIYNETTLKLNLWTDEGWEVITSA